MSSVSLSGGLPHHAGIGLKPDHFRDVIEADDTSFWVEVHPENYMVEGGPRLAFLSAIRGNRALSFHGVGASLGGIDPLDTDHLLKLSALIDRFQPDQVSEHAAWCAHHGVYYSDLLPVPRTNEALDNLVCHIDQFQSGIQRTILIENPSNYLPFASDMDEPDFLMEAARRSGCGLLLDVNNIWISANNIGIDAHQYIKAIAPDLVGEIHIAGYDEDPALGKALLIDSHGSSVKEDVWSLLEFALGHLGPKPVLVERDANIPPYIQLNAERIRAEAAIEVTRGKSEQVANVIA